MRKLHLVLVVLSGISAASLWTLFTCHFYPFIRDHKPDVATVPSQLPDGGFIALYVAACIGGALGIGAGILYEPAKDRFTATAVAALNLVAIWGFMELHRVGALMEHAEYVKLHGAG